MLTMEDIRQVMRRRLDSRERINFLAVLLRIARVDDVSPAERDRMLPVLDWIGARESELTEAMRRADDPDLKLAELVQAFDTEPERLLLFRECCSVAWVDGRISEDEAQLVEHLALLLRIDERSRYVLDSPLACSPEGERRFLELLQPTSDS